MAIQPKNTVDVKFDTVVSKTASAGVIVEGARFKANGIDAVAATDFPLALNGAVRWRFLSASSLDFRPEADLARSIGTTSFNLLNLYAQNILVSGAAQSVGTASSHVLEFQTNSVKVAAFGTAGDLTMNASNGGNLIFTRDLYGVVVAGSATFAATGATQATAALLTKLITVVTTATTSTQDGIILPAAGSHLFKQFMLINESGVLLDIFPDSGSNINDATANTAITMADNTRRIFIAITATRWISTAAI